MEYARACLRDSLLRGEAPIASHLLYTQPVASLDDSDPVRTISDGIGRRICGRPSLMRASSTPIGESHVECNTGSMQPALLVSRLKCGDCKDV